MMKHSLSFAKGFLKTPLLQWRRILARIELKTGFSTLWYSPGRIIIRLFERSCLRPLPAEKRRRVGNYFIYRDIQYDQTSIVYSAGVGTNISFDLELHDLYAPQIHLIDPTPNSKKFLDSQNLPDHFIFHEMALSTYDGEISFYPDYHQNDLERASSFSIHNRSGSRTKLTVPCVRLRSLMTKNGHDHIDLLKMDIEGAASVVLYDALKHDIRPRQIICEFEMPSHPVRCLQEIHRIRKLLRMMKVRGYDVYSITDVLLGTRIEIVAVLKS